MENGLEGKGEFLKFAEQYKWSPYKDAGFLGESNIKAGYGIYTKAQTKFAKGEVDETYVNNAYTTFVKILTDNLVHSVSGITTGKTDVDYIKQRLQEILPKKMSSFIDEYLDNITSFSKRNAEYNSGGNYIDEESKALKELIELGSGVNQRAEDIFTIDAKDDLQNLFDETKISAENFQSVLESVCNILGIEIPQNTEKAKESIKEVTSTADSPSSTSNPSIEHQIKSESELNAEIEKRENIIRELQQLQEKLTVHEDFHGNDKYFADQLPTEEEIREADKRIKQLIGTNNIFDVQKLIQDRNEWLSEVKYSLEEYDDLIKTNDQKVLDEYTTRGLSRIDGAESFFGYEDNNFSIASKFAEEKEKIQNEINDLYIDLDKLDEKQNEAIDESIKKTLTLNDVRQKQWEIIQKTNPKEEGTNSTWIDNPEDVKTFYEVNHKDSDYPFNENYSDDWTVKDKMNVEATGKITVYSSYPIEDGNWVTPSKEEGLSYAGNGKLYSATIDPRDIAWVDAGQGQVAHISDELKEVIDLSTKAETQVQSIDNKTNETDNQSTLNTLDDTIAKYETIVALVKEYYDLSNNKKDTIGMSSDDDERISEIRKQLKSYTQNPDYDGEYKMGFGGSGKNIFAKSVDLSQEEMLQEICNMLGVEIPKNADKAKEAIKDVTTATPKESNISSASNSPSEASRNNNISDSIKKKKEALASYELQLEETRYEVEKLSKSENKVYGFNRSYNDKKVASLRDSVTKRLFGEYDPSSGKDGSKKWFALGRITNIDTSTLKSYQMWQEELQKVGYTLSEIKQTSMGLEADIIPIDGKAITNAEEFRKTLDNISTTPSENVQLLNKQITDLESKISSLKYEIASLESPASNQRKDAFLDSSTDTKPETEGMEQVEKATEEATNAKKDFVEANKGVQSSIDGSENPLKLEAELMEQIAKSAREAANAKKEFVEANKQVKDSADGSNNDLNSGNKKGRYAKAVKLSNDDFMSKYDDFLKKGNELASKTNGSILGGNVDVSYDDVNGLAKVSAKIKDVDGNWRIFSAKLDSDLNVFSQSFKIITSNVKNLDRQLNQLNQENQEVSRSFIFEPNTEGFDDIIAKFGILREQAEQITKIVKATKQTADGADISYKATLKNGSSYYLGENSTPQVLNASETIYDSNAIEKAYQEATKVNNALNETNSLLNSLKVPNGFEGSFSTLKSEIKQLNSEFGSGKISATEYANNIKKAFSDYQTPIDNRSKDIWNELTTSLNRYATLQKRIANNNALSTDNEEATRLLEHIHELQRNDILPTDKLTASNKKLQQINQTVTDLKAKLKESTLDSLQGSIDKYQKIYDQRSTYSSDFTPSEQYTKNLAELDTAIRDLAEYRNTLKNVGEVTVEQETHLKGLVTACEKASDSFKSLSASEKGASQLAIDKLVQRINKDLDENTNYSRQAKQGLRALRDELESANPRNLKEITSEIINIENAEIEAGRAGRSFIDTIMNSGFHQIAAQIAGMFGFDDAINLIKEGINTVRELDTAMTEVRKVSDATEAQYASFRDTISSTAKEIASTNKELLNSSADFLRLGYSLDQASDLAKNATLFVNVGDGVDITEATEDMITAMKAFDIKAEDSIKIVDDYNQIGNRFALSASDIGEAMKRSASALETGNNSFEQSISLITAMNEIVQNSENTGNSLKVLSLRLRGAKAELENMQEDTDGLCESTSKLREQIKSLTGVDIMLDDNTFKSTTDIIKELGTVWDKLSDSSQAATLELIAGKSRANNVAALLKNYQKIDEVMESLGDAEGSALRENEAIVNSIDGRIKVLSATAEEFWQKFIDTDFVKNAISLATDLLGLLTQIIDKFGTLPIIATGIAAAFSFKNVGIDTLVAY